MNSFPHLSILIPAYNNTKSLVRALNSVKEQSIAKELIILISDDSSPIPIEVEKINTFKEYFHKLSIFKQDNNLGILTNPAWLFNQVETNFFSILQHDDVILRKDFYEEAVNKLLENKKLVSYFGNSIIVRSKENPEINIHKKASKHNLMLKINSPRIKGLKNDNSMSGEDFIDNITNQYDDFNTAWSAIIFRTRAARKIGGFGGNYCLSWFEANSLKIYREEEYFGCLYLLCFQGDVQLDKEPSVIRCLEPTSFSESPTHPVRKIRQDGEVYAMFKVAWIAEKLFKSASSDNIIRHIYNKCSKIPLREENKSSKLFFKTYLPIDREKQKLALNAIKSSRSLKSPFELFYKIKAYLRYYRNILREKRKLKKNPRKSHRYL